MISVCIATYNGEKYVNEQIESILKQLSSEDEIIVSDDGSNDNTCEIIRNINDDRIKLYKNNGMHGFTHNFENAISKAKGEYIFLADQDDVWADNKVKITMEYLKLHDFTISDCVTVDENLTKLQDSRFKAFNMKCGFIRHLIKSRFLGCCMAFRKNVLKASIPFPLNDSLLEHDIWLAAIGFLYFDTVLIHEPLIYYRRHGKNASNGGFKKGYSLFNKIYRRLYRITCLLRIAKKVKEIKVNSD